MLVTFSDLKTLYGMPYLNTTNEAQYNNLLLTAEEEVLEYADLKLSGQGSEFIEANGGRSFLLLLKPILEVTDVLLDGGSIAFRYEPRSRRIVLPSPCSGTLEVKEKYGFSSTPLILKKCIAETVQYWAKYLNSNLVGVTSRSTDLGTENLEQWELPISVKSALERFKNQAVV